MKQMEQFLPFWSILEQSEQEQMKKESISVSYRKGTMMRQCEQGCSGIMLVLSGQLRTYIMSEEGREVTLFRVYANDVCVLSAVGLMDAIVFDVMIDAVEDTEIIMIPVTVLEPMMQKYPQIEAYLYRTATERFSDVVWTMQQMLFLSTDKRVAIFLWDEISRTGSLEISMTHDEIARYIGSAREVITKVLKYFASEGVVSLGRGKLQIIDKEKLRKYL